MGTVARVPFNQQEGDMKTHRNEARRVSPTSSGLLAWVGMEPLEGRVLLSASLDSGVLTLQASDGNNTIIVSDGGAGGSVRVSGVPGVDRGTEFEGVERLVIRAGSGNDRVVVREGLTDPDGAALEADID